MMIYSLVKNILSKLDFVCYFYISQIKSSLYEIFYKVVYHHVIYMCDFFGEFIRLFFIVFHGLHRFSRRLWFALDTLPFYLSILVVE